MPNPSTLAAAESAASTNLAAVAAASRDEAVLLTECYDVVARAAAAEQDSAAAREVAFWVSAAEDALWDIRPTSPFATRAARLGGLLMAVRRTLEDHPDVLLQSSDAVSDLLGFAALVAGNLATEAKDEADADAHALEALAGPQSDPVSL